MKIAFVMHNIVRGDGQGRIQYEIVRRAIACGHQTVAFADRIAPELLEDGVEWVRIPKTPARPALAGGYQFAGRADRALAQRRSEFDVVVGAGFTLRASHDVSLCQFVHGAWLRSPYHDSRLGIGLRAMYQSLYSRSNGMWERGSYAAARNVVAPSEGVRRELESIGVAPGKIKVIPNAVDPDEFRPGSVRRADLGLPLGVPLALFVGDINTSRKNLDSVLKALATVPGLHLAIAGAADRSPFPRLAEQLGVADRAHFLGFRRDIPQLMQGCDLFVFPTRYEPFGLVILEALSSGLPVITTRASGAAELMDEECGVVLDDPEDVPRLAAAMAKLAGGSLGARGAEAARDTALRNTWTCMADRYLSLFEECRDEIAHSEPRLCHSC